MFVSGCRSGPEQIGPRRATDWAYAPHTIAVHALSRFNNSNSSEGKQTIVVHVEFRDGDGFACRGMGLLSVVVTNRFGIRVGSTSINLADPKTNRAYFDEVTRTYRVQFDRVSLEHKKVSASASLAVAGEETLRSSEYNIDPRTSLSVD